jgi:enamine deaminase RidA (YjgF/YER057c/UK114 family)
MNEKLIKDNLLKNALVLPKPPQPGGSYEAVNVVGDIIYVAIQLPKLNDEFLFQGRLGKEISTEDGYKAAQLCALNVLSQINTHIGFNRLLAINHFDAYYQAFGDWEEAPKVIDGASHVFLNILGEKGKHTRAIFGVERLPRNMCVGITATFTLV